MELRGGKSMVNKAKVNKNGTQNKLIETYSKETRMRLRVCGNVKVNKDYNCKQNTLGEQTNCFEQKVCKQNPKNKETSLQKT